MRVRKTRLKPTVEGQNSAPPAASPCHPRFPTVEGQTSAPPAASPCHPRFQCWLACEIPVHAPSHSRGNFQKKTILRSGVEGGHVREDICCCGMYLMHETFTQYTHSGALFCPSTVLRKTCLVGRQTGKPFHVNVLLMPALAFADAFAKRYAMPEHTHGACACALTCARV